MLGTNKDSHREATSARGEQTPRDTTITDIDPVLVLSSSTSCYLSLLIPLTIYLDSNTTEHGSDVE